MTLAGRAKARSWTRLGTALVAMSAVFAIATPHEARARDADDLLVVDCLLPGKVQRLGKAATYVRGRKAVKITARECRVFGGEYTEEGDATYASLMKIWLPAAKEGNAEAQTNLGEIFEKGTGGPPQADLAAQWYQLAAEQGYARAQVNLGSLYERGFGVPRDPAKAMDLYRKASGLDTLNISYLPAPQGDPEASAKAREQDQELAALRAERDRLSVQLAEERQKSEALRNQRDAVNSRLLGERSSVQQVQQQLALAQTELDLRNSAIEEQKRRLARLDADETKRSGAEKKLVQLRQQLDAQRKVVAERDAQLKALQDSVGRLEDQASNLQTRLVQAENQRDAAMISQQGVAANQSAVRQADATQTQLSVKDQLLGQVDFGRYHALVIGNVDFRHIPQLRTAQKDAEVVADILKTRYGFNTTVLVNADRYSLLSALNELREKLTPDDNLLIYYAGHGDLDAVNDRGYWLPVDAEAVSTANWIPTYQVTDILNAMSAKQVMLVADSCYSGMLTRSAIGQLNVGMTDESKLRWYKAMATKHSRVVLTSGGVQPVLDGGGGEHSVFAKAFIETLMANDKILEGQKLAQEIIRRVAISEMAAEIEQVPVYAPIRFAGHEAGDFFFIPRS